MALAIIAPAYTRPSSEVAEARDRFFAYLKFRNYSLNSVRAYERTVHEFTAGIGNVEELDRRHALDYLLSLYDRKNSARSRSRALSIMKKFCRFLQAEGLLQKNPVELIEHPKLPTRLPKVWNTEQLGGLIDQIAALKTNRDPWLDARDKLIFEILFGSGLRVGELVNLDIGDVDRHQKLLFIRQGKGRKDRIVPFGRQAAAALASYIDLRHPSEALILNEDFTRITSRSVGRIVKSYGERFCHDNSLHPHLLRHGCATAMAESGADILYIKDLLGHSSISTTQIYTHLSIKHIQRVHAATHPRGGLAPTKKSNWRRPRFKAGSGIVPRLVP